MRGKSENDVHFWGPLHVERMNPADFLFHSTWLTRTILRTYVCCVLSTSACGPDLEPAEEAFLGLGPGEQVDVIMNQPPREAIELYILTMTYNAPPNIPAQLSLAEKGAVILPAALQYLEEASSSTTKIIVLELLVAIQIGKYYCVACDENAMTRIRQEVAEIQESYNRERGKKLIEDFLQR
ncbi:MAG: hypothetical protein ACRD3V_01060 [Vicinamibacteria bacterium]